ncbi:MAG: LLM class flavin-dependent oxidoreductase [Vulcanimicrobiaceae bacterium]
MSLSLSILDQSPVVAGATPSDAVLATIELARAAERLGYERFWLAEHHAMGGLADASPEILLARLTATTTRIRLGTGGIMAPHYSALKIAENFRMLEALAPGRIDLGLGRAPGGTPLVSAALESRDAGQFPQQVFDTIGWLRGTLPTEHRFASLVAMPSGATAPQPWILGSSEYGAALAAELGLPYVFAHFIAGDAPYIPQIYRRRFRATSLGAEPRLMVATGAVVAPTDEEARELYAPYVLWRARLLRGVSTPVPSRAETRAHAWLPGEFDAALRSRRVAVGDPATVRERLESLAEDHAADEAMVVTIVPEYAARLRSYELLAEAFAPTGSTAIAV